METYQTIPQRTYRCGSGAAFNDYPVFSGGMTPVHSYGQAGFTDVASDWSYSPIKTCYELGLMSEQSLGKFGPNNKVTIAEGMVATARIHNFWRGGDGSFPSSTPWFRVR